jgi:hypothetical protein
LSARAWSAGRERVGSRVVISELSIGYQCVRTGST